MECLELLEEKVCAKEGLGMGKPRGADRPGGPDVMTKDFDSFGFSTVMKQTNLATGKQRPIKRAPFSINAFR